VIPDLIKKVLQGQDPIEILGDGRQTRAFTHVRDIARGIILAMESETAVNEDFNISAARETEVLELARLVFDACATGREFRVVSVPGFTHDVQRRIPSTEKARRVLGFEAEVPLEAGIGEVIGWLRATMAPAAAGASDATPGLN
jgi:nucleoside-diphosphate-sugar epimerase